MEDETMNRVMGWSMPVLLAVTLAGPALAASDKEFLSDALKGDNSEIALGDMAQKMGSTEQVRSFGQELSTDHATAKKQVTTLAAKLHVKTTEAVTPEAKQEMKKLQGLSGKQFDQEFARYMVEDHQKDIAKFKEKAAEGKSETAKLAEETVPVLEKHLKTAQSLSSH
jgi:putative membrane protein